MTNVLILYYFSYGHIERRRREAGAEAAIKRVPELVPEDVAEQSGYKLDQSAPIATVAELDEWSQAHVDRSEPAGPDHTANEPNQQSINGSTGIAAIRA